MSDLSLVTGVVAGRLPIHDNEALIGGNLAKSMGLGIGDELAVDGADGEERRFVVCGLLSAMFNAGYGTILTYDGVCDPVSYTHLQQEEVEQEQAERMMRANLTLNDFIDMNRQIRKMGGISKLISALPGGDKAMSQGQVDEGALDHMEVIINSMTKAEREKPDLLNGSRRARIAAGAGVTVSDVNQLIKKFNETKKMMKKMMPAVEDLQGGKKGKKGKKGRRRRMGLPGMGGMSMADIKKLQDMMGE